MKTVDPNTNLIAFKYHEVQSQASSPAIPKELYPKIPVESVSSKHIRKKPAAGTQDILW
jgi:hypothetical protein